MLRYKLKLFLCILFAIFTISVNAQSAEITALENQIAASGNSTAKVDLMHNLFYNYFAKSTDAYKKANTEKITELCKTALAISEKLNYEKGKIVSYGNLATIYKYYALPNLYIKYQYKYSQNKKALDQINAQEIVKIKEQQKTKEAEMVAAMMAEQKAKEAEIAELEKNKTLNSDLIEKKKQELSATKSELTSTLSIMKDKEGVIAQNQIQIKGSQDSLAEQGKANDSLSTQNQILANEKEIIALSAKAAKAKNWIYFLMGAIAVIFAIFMIVIVISMNRNRLKLKEKNDLIIAEKERSDELLLNILPVDMAIELKKNGFAKAQSFDNVTVFFSDFKDFTKISAQLTPSELVTEIDICFKAFDKIIEKYDIEKIKTVGDAYICVTGLNKNKTHNPTDIILASIEIREFIANRVKSQKKLNKLFFEIRIGIHTGPIVAGIVGFKKFAYDIWGDTVNTAARMEQSSLAGKINVSSVTFELVKEFFTFTYRGKVEAKNMGEIDMYFIHDKI